MLKALGRYTAVIVYCIYLFLCYHLLVLGAFADWSWYSFILVPIVFILFWLVPREQRKAAVVYTLLFIFFDQALYRVRWMETHWYILNAIFIGLVIYPIGRWYAKLKLMPITLALVVAFTLNTLLPDRMAQGLSHLWPMAVTKQLYVGELKDPFPFTLADIDGDHKDEIITIGNTDQPARIVRIDDRTFEVEDVQFTLFVYEWDKGLKRIPAEAMDASRVKQLVPQEYVGFPYYILTDDLKLQPLVIRQELAESMTQFGTAPFRALVMNAENIRQLLEQTGGVYDRVEQTGRFTDLVLAAGRLSGSYDGQPFEVDSDATEIIGAIQLGEGRQGLIVKGMNISLYELLDGNLTETHVLTRAMQPNLAQSQIMITDVNHNGIEEMMIAFPYTIILEPGDDGVWKILWGTRERSFRVETMMNQGTGSETLLAMQKSVVRASDTNYLTGFTYTDEGLQRKWKVFLPGVVRAIAGDLDGDGRDEIVMTRTDNHKLYIWTPHRIPVIEILSGLTVLLAVGLAVLRLRRWRHAK